MILLRYAPLLMVLFLLVLGIFMIKLAIKIVLKLIVGFVLIVGLVIVFLNFQEIRHFVGDFNCTNKAEELERSQKESFGITGITPQSVYEGCMKDF
jgi:hypothetical protein